MKKLNTRTLTVMAMLSAVAYVLLFVGRIPVVLFLKYDPKDAIIAIGGFMFGPAASAIITLVVSFIEMVTISDTGFIGLLMNVIGSCSFACTAAYIYKKNRTIKGAIIGLVVGTVFMTLVMLLWNYMITPIYMHYPREAVAGMLLPAFLPFNLIKGGLNTALALLLYKPVISAFRKLNFVEPSQSGRKGGLSVGVIVLAAALIITCTLLILVLRGVI